MAFDFPNAPTLGLVYQGWTWDGEKWISTASPPPNQSGVISIQVFTASGQYMPSPNMTTCVIECVGGGGGGGGVAGTASQIYCGGGGGSGGYSRIYATAATIGVSQTVTVGTGGAGGAGSNNGSNGNDVSVGTLCIAKGGAGGKFGSNAQVGLGGAGGIAGTGNVVAAGANGSPGFYNSINTGITFGSGNGGSSTFGGGALGINAPGAAAASGLPGSNYGGGGSGAGAGNTAATATGGSGSSGLVIVTEYGMTALSSATAQLGSVRYDLPQGLSSAQMSQGRANIAVTKRNYLINGAFQINQGGYVSAAVLAAAAYGHDQWKAGAAGGDYSFTQSTGSTTVTIAAGKTLIQPIEDVRVTGGGSYVLAWTGTAQARAGVNTLTPVGAYAASPLLITGQTDGTVMSVEFNTGTLSQVSLTEGTVAPPFQLPDFQQELAACQRYYFKTFDYATQPKQNNGYAGSLRVSTNATSTFGGSQSFPVVMRIPPTVTTYSPVTASANWYDSNNSAERVASIAFIGTQGVSITGTAGVIHGLNNIQITASARL